MLAFMGLKGDLVGLNEVVKLVGDENDGLALQIVLHHVLEKMLKLKNKNCKLRNF